MALGTEAKAVNTAAMAYLTAVGAWYEAATVNDVLQMTPIDLSRDSSVDQSQQTDTVGDMATANAGVHPTFTTVYSMIMVNDGEFPFALPIKLPDSVTPLVWVVTNPAQDLDVT